MTNLSQLWNIARHFGVSRACALWAADRAEPEAMKEWRAFLDLHIDADARMGMLLRPLRPYMRQHFTRARRRELLRQHIETMQRHFAPDPRLNQEPGVVVATLKGKQEATYFVTLGGNTSKEGELAFGLYDTHQRYLARMAASIGQNESGAAVLWVGSLQGAKPPMGRDEVVKATRELYGLRPKGAVLLAAQTFAQALGLTALYAPSNEAHISQRGLKKISKKRKIHADYAEFWEEVGGIKVGEEEYQLPITPQVRDISDVKPNKRSEWKKRQALSEQLQADVRVSLTKLQRSSSY